MTGAGASIWGSGLRGGPGSCALARELALRDPPRIRPGGSALEGKGGRGSAPPVPASRGRPPSRRGPAHLVTLGRGRGAGSAST